VRRWPSLPLLATLLLVATGATAAAVEEPPAARRIVATPPATVVTTPVIEQQADPSQTDKANRVLGLLANPGELSAVHAIADGLSHCIDCHALGGGVRDEKCLVCHPRIGSGVQEGRGLHGHLDKPCHTCHTEHEGRAKAITTFTPRDFDHERRTGYPLTLGHRDATCDQCHNARHTISGRPTYLGLERACTACHADPHAGQFNRLPATDPTTGVCTNCHTMDSWQRPRFDHDTTRFKLAGVHKGPACVACHRQGQMHDSPRTCDGCHASPHASQFDALVKKANATTDPCSLCHRPSRWAELAFDHAKSRFPLAGAHQKATCLQCHRDGKFEDNTLDCTGCHANRHGDQFNQRITNAAAGKGPGAACLACHTIATWRVAKFDHDLTDFKLTGAHQKATCAQCHHDTTFETRDTACLTCHATWHDSGLRFAGTHEQRKDHCLDCHTTTTWRVAKFDHDQTDFKLTGAHKQTACTQCHGKTTFAREQVACADCHRDPHDLQFAQRASTRPPATACLDCHTTSAWLPATYDHQRDGYQVEASLLSHVRKHEKQPTCLGCHALGQFARDRFTCTSCHRDGHAGQLSDNCRACHQIDSWEIDLDRHAELDFKLEGRHREITCAACHAETIGLGHLDPSCSACHQDRHGGSYGGSQACADCHSQEDWQTEIGLRTADRAPVFFDHTTTDFPLEGAHARVACGDCHFNSQFTGNDTRCYTCHWQRSQDDVWSLAIGNECGDCHTPAAWTPARWSHTDAPASYPLEGSHARAACLDCHAGYRARGTSHECITCHQGDLR